MKLFQRIFILSCVGVLLGSPVTSLASTVLQSSTSAPGTSRPGNTAPKLGSTGYIKGNGVKLRSVSNINTVIGLVYKKERCKVISKTQKALKGLPYIQVQMLSGANKGKKGWICWNYIIGF